MMIFDPKLGKGSVYSFLKGMSLKMSVIDWGVNSLTSRLLSRT